MSSKSNDKDGSRRQRVETGHVRQSFSHGRTKQVVVERKRPRTGAGASDEKPATRTRKTEAASEATKSKTKTATKTAAKKVTPKTSRDSAAKSSRASAGGLILRTLTEEEKAARNRALSQAREREEQERKEARERARQAEEAERLRQKEAEENRAKVEEDRVRRDAENAERRLAETEAQRRLEVTDSEAPSQDSERQSEGRSGKRGRGGDSPNRQQPRRRMGELRGRSSGKLTLSNALADDERQRSLAAIRRQQERGRARNAQSDQPAKKISREVVIPERITIQELANRMAERAIDVIKVLMQQGTMAKIADVIDSDTAQLVAEELGHTVKRVAESDVEDILGSLRETDAKQEFRAPVVTVMGHVDHGKTSLLDLLRKSDVAAKESGGITQHIGAYRVAVQGGGVVTFLDTPGHAAFAAMRARGARLTDIVVLVVAADDGVMPQTEEAIRHAREAKVPMIVAINKIDKPGANADKVRQDLLRHEVVTEEMGGEVLSVALSAKTGEGMDKLLEAISLQAELMELRATVDCPAAGVVLEARMEHGRGHMATLLIQQGRLHVGDIFVAGAQWGRVRALLDDRGKQMKEAGTSMPVEVMGLSGTPDAGDVFTVLPDEAKAREIVEYRQRKQNELRVGSVVRGGNVMEELMERASKAEIEELTILVKADVQGSAEAVSQMLGDMEAADEVKVRVVYSGVGDVSESDVALAATSKAMIVGFNVRVGAPARVSAGRMGVEVRRYSVIYNLVDDVRAALKGMLSPHIEETRLGEGKVLEIFDISKMGKVAGCRIEDGQIRRGAKIRVLRDGKVLFEGSLSSLRRFKDEVREVVAGQECGMAFESFQEFAQGDAIECFDVKEVERELA